MKTVRHPLKRCYGRHDLHSILTREREALDTFSCYRRRPYLGTVRARNRFIRILDQVRWRHAFALIGYVVMPEHVHLLIGEPPRGNPSRVLQVLKHKVSRSLRGRRITSTRQLRLPFASQAKEPPAFWQRRFYDFNVWSEKKLREKLNFLIRDREAVNMHANPISGRLVKHPGEWPWSSFSFYAKDDPGLIRIDPVDSNRGEMKNVPPFAKNNTQELSAALRLCHPPAKTGLFNSGIEDKTKKRRM